MANVSNGLQFPPSELGYLAAHAQWQIPELYVMVALAITMETQGWSNAYREAALNPAGGNDMGVCAISDKWQPKPDPFTRFDPIVCLRDARAIWVKSKFTPWKYPSASRTDAIINLAGITAAIGPNPYAIDRSPYWRMVEANMNVAGLPVPTPGAYVSRLPAAPLKYGNHGGTNPTAPDHGVRINQLQRILQEMGEYPPGGTDQWFGNNTRAGVTAVQHKLFDCRLWAAVFDGVYSIAMREVWDGVLSFDHYRRGR